MRFELGCENVIVGVVQTGLLSDARVGFFVCVRQLLFSSF
jgi:hypothetical protein